MNRKNLLFVTLSMLAASLFVACEETEEATEYDDWKERNDAFIDSIQTVTGENYLTWGNPITRVTTDVESMELGELYAVQVMDGGTTSTPYKYSYMKKLVENPEGMRIISTDVLKVYIYCTYIDGDEVFGNFVGYSALDTEIPLTAEDMIWPTDFDEPEECQVNSSVYFPGGVEWALQYARSGERLLVYVPYTSGVGYGTTSYSGTSFSVLAYSALTFDIIIEEITED